MKDELVMRAKLKAYTRGNGGKKEGKEMEN